jgi:hypothetical protein
VVIAVESASVLVAPNPITNLLLGLAGSSESGQFLVFFGLLTAAGLAAVIIGLVAAITGRGRGWGVTAIALAIVGNIQFLELVRALVGHSA